MIEVLIVDDEYFIIQRLKKIIDWKENGFTIVGEAKEGKTALEKVLLYKPQIVIIDINMPIMDGIEFAKIMNSQYAYLGIKIIFLTGHSDFNYAKKAIEYGVINYLLKPVNTNELLTVLQDCKVGISKANLIKKQYKKLEETVHSFSNIIREKSLTKLLMDGNISGEEFETLNLNIVDNKIQCITIEIIYKDLISKDEQKLWEFAVYNIIKELLLGYKEYEIVSDKEKRIVILINTYNLKNERLMILCRNIIHYIERYTLVSVCIGIGKPSTSFYTIPESHNTSLQALNNKIMQPNDQIIEYETLDFTVNPISDFNKDMQNITIQLRLGNQNIIKEIINSIFNRLSEDDCTYINLDLVFSNLILTAIEFANENSVSIYDLLGEQYSANEIIQKHDNLPSLYNWTIDLFNNLVDVVKRKSTTTQSKEIVIKAKNYIDNHYTDCEINLKLIAHKIFISSSYLSTTFKKEAGISVIDYITKKRMEEAKRLVDYSIKSIKEIAETIGYSDSRYFSKCFKKYYGMSPKKYIQLK